MPGAGKMQQWKSFAVSVIFPRGNGCEIAIYISSHANFSQLTSLIKDRVDRGKKEFRYNLDGTFQSNDGVVSAHVGFYCSI